MKITAQQLIAALKKQPSESFVSLSAGDGYNADLHFHCGSVYFEQERLDSQGDGEFAPGADL